jgi:hypothetical protein
VKGRNTTYKQERIRDGVATTYRDSLSKYSGGGNEENHENLDRIIGAMCNLLGCSLAYGV